MAEVLTQSLPVIALPQCSDIQILFEITQPGFTVWNWGNCTKMEYAEKLLSGSCCQAAVWDGRESWFKGRGTCCEVTKGARGKCWMGAVLVASLVWEKRTSLLGWLHASWAKCLRSHLCFNWMRESCVCYRSVGASCSAWVGLPRSCVCHWSL